MSRDIYIRAPPTVDGKDILWKLKKLVYGLANASLYWSNKVKEMLGTGAQVDPAVFYWLDECKLKAVVACHVYDFHLGRHTTI